MTTQTMWGPREDDDHLGNPAKIAMFDMPGHWDQETDPHPNTKVMNSIVDFGKKYINFDSGAGTGFSSGSEAGTSAISPLGQANSWGLSANDTLRPSTAMGSFTYEAPDLAKSKPQQSPWLQAGSAFTQSLDSVNAGNMGAAAATPDLIGGIGGQYLKRGSHGAVAQTRAAEATATPDLFRAAGKGYLKHGMHENLGKAQQQEATATPDLLATVGSKVGRAMVDHGTLAARHNNDTAFSAHFNDDLEGYAERMNKIRGDSANAWLNTDTGHDRHIIETYGDDAKNEMNFRGQKIGHHTSKGAMLFNELLNAGLEKYENRNILAHEVVNNRIKWEDINCKMMTASDIRRDTAENFANDTFKYLYQTGLSRHFVNLVMVRAFRGAPFMMQDGIGILDASVDIWADNIINKGDESYINALKQAVKENHPSQNDVLVGLVASYMGGPTGDALQFFWDTSTREQKNRMMKEVCKRQSDKMQTGVTGSGAAVYP